MLEYTPKQIVQELDRFIIGQNEAKKAVAVALRNRYRREHIGCSLFCISKTTRLTRGCFFHVKNYGFIFQYVKLYT